MTVDEMYMQRCLQLASLGLGDVQPNPMVGAVIVKDGQIIGEGYHHKYGGPHAEVNAIDSVKDKELLKKSTIYVNLEPCSHFGKTPPCADLIIRMGIPKVVVGTVDYHDKVNGHGIAKLQDAGIEVVTGVCEADCIELNKRFFTYHRQHRPYVILKWAQTADGYMDIDRSESPVDSYWITNPSLKVVVHKWRSEEDAILVGHNTMLNDKPQLTTRLYPGKDPQRYLMQRGDEQIAPLPCTLTPSNVEECLHIMYDNRVQSVIIEGGRKTLDMFITSGLWDEARILVGSQYWGKGLPAPVLTQTPNKIEVIDNNKIMYVRRHL
ncbi:MAG: bifunctional diaminohydroxyphosphoribosylaminopyrimidine deaminase/5-amino-6-(5-phosphoribosylamino)uracil reductase RibD [Bacteroidales bacterium]|nr:bifunctional diaminohydroxyphosphoribosylaminopyrimidine deaminase/5-amino-6-(5-phosphoribosylamino)uracil reductase RibD [Bacteroidales bacterium]